MAPFAIQLNVYESIYILHPFQPLPFQHLNYMDILSLLHHPSNNIHQYLTQDHPMLNQVLDPMLPLPVELQVLLDPIAVKNMSWMLVP